MDDMNNHTPKVSIAVAVYKAADYIEKCVRSLFEQTLDDLEFIFVDDASPDESVAIIERTLQDYPNRQGQVKILHHEHNMDLPQTRWDGLDAATGEYFIYVDSDDWVETNYAELLYNKAKETEADIVVCDFYIDKSNESKVFYSLPDDEGDVGERLRDNTLNRQCFPTLWIRLFRRRLFYENEIVWPKYGMSEDVTIILQATYYAKKLAYLNVPLYHYWRNENSYSQLKDEMSIYKRFYSAKGNIDILNKFMRQKGISAKYASGIIFGEIEVRNYLIPLLNKPKYWWKHISTYPEINLIFLFPNKYYNPPLRKRLRMLITLLGLYPLLSKVIGEKDV